MIELQDVSVIEKNKIIIDKLSHTFKTGSCTAIIGANGAGKSCLIKTIIGQIQHTTGRIVKPNQIGYCPDKMQLYTHLSIQQLQNRANTNQQRAHILQLDDYAHTPYRQLSQGNQQKVHIIQSLVTDASTYIWDEPTQHLDPQSRYHVHDIMQTLKEQGKTIIYTTHFLEDIGPHTDQCIILNGGKIHAILTPPFTQDTIQSYFQNKKQINNKK